MTGNPALTGADEQADVAAVMARGPSWHRVLGCR